MFLVELIAGLEELGVGEIVLLVEAPTYVPYITRAKRMNAFIKS